MTTARRHPVLSLSALCLAVACLSAGFVLGRKFNRPQSTAVASPIQPPAGSLSVEGETLVVRGEIMQPLAADFLHMLEEHDIRKIRIGMVGGGQVAEALIIADAIHTRGLDIEVDGNCFSSCANYIFASGRTKTILPGGLVGWHGNMSHVLYLHARDRYPMSERDLTGTRRLAEAEQRFFSKIGVNGFVTWAGKIPPHDAPNIFVLGKDDMERFGMKNLRVPADYPSLNPDQTPGIDVKHLRIDWATFDPTPPASSR